jgi:hypothetical protein
MSFVPHAAQAQWYRHKSEAQIAAMTPAQRVDEYVKESIKHYRNALDDDHADLIQKYVWFDSLKALPRIIEVMDEYDPTTRSGRSKNKDVRFDVARGMLNDLDNNVLRIRASEEGKRAIDALERAIKRMQSAGYGVKKGGFDWHYSALNIAIGDLKSLKGVNGKDHSIQDTFRFRYKEKLSDSELLEFSNYLTEYFSEYPGWSKGKLTKDDTDIAPDGLPYMNIMLEKPERFYEAYLEFKKTK